MADESEEESTEERGGLSEVDSDEIPPPEEMPRPEKPGAGPEDLPEEVEDLPPDDEGEADENSENAPGEDGEDDASGGLTKVDPEDRDRDPDEMRSHRPNTMGPDDASERAPPDPDDGLPFDPDDSRDLGASPGLGSSGDESTPPPGHAQGAPRPGETLGEDDGGTEVEAKPEVTPESAEAGGEVTPEAPVNKDAEPSDVGPFPSAETAAETDTESTTEAPIAEPNYDVPEYEDQWDAKPAEPPDDEEMPLADHVEEMVRRLGIVLLTVAAGTAVSFIGAEFILMAMWNGLVPGGLDPHVYGPLEKILTEIKVASLGGILVALPVLVYESYLFMRPGLYPKERRYYLAAVPTSLVLGGVGMLFSYFLVLPVLFSYFNSYSKQGVDTLAYGLQVTFDLIVTMLWAFALVFQIPLLIMLAIMMGVVTREWMEQKRIYFWGGFLGLGFFMGGIDPTNVAGFIIAGTMIGLFEGTLAVLRWAQGDLPWRNRGSSS